jgi:type II secretory pathway component PulF
MPRFVYKAISPQGQIVKNSVDDASKVSCIRKLKRNGLTPISVTQTLTVTRGSTNKAKKNTKSAEKLRSELISAKISQKSKSKQPLIERIDRALMSTEKITPRDIRVFTQNFYLLKKASFNNIHALSTVIETTENPKFRSILEDILAGVESGEFMYTTMEYYSNVFPFIYINMIKVGELSGSLESSLEQAVAYLDSSDTLTKKLKKILLPNIAMFIGIWILLIVAVIVGVPMLQGIFDEIGGGELPAITLKFAAFVNLVIEYWYIPVSIIAIAIGSFIFWISTPRGRYQFDYFKYKMPIFGKLIYSLDFTRLMRSVELNLENGMRIQDSLEVSKNVVKNNVMLSVVETAINNIFIGQSWIEPFEKTGLSSAMTTEMLKIGMQTDLTEMMKKLIQYMEQDIDNLMEIIIKVLPEVTYAVVGVVLIFFVVVVLVPCIQMYMGDFLFEAYGF